MPALWIASGNEKKRRELERLLAPLDVQLHTPKELDAPFDPVEDQPDFAGNAAIKARALTALTNAVTIADDSGICVDALDGRPGVRSARYGGPGLDDAGRVGKLLEELAAVPDEQRTARFVCSLCLCGPDGAVRLAVEEACEGLLLRAPRGAGGFGYDPIFVAREHAAEHGLAAARAFAQLSAEEKDALSHRGKALRALRARLLAEPDLLEA